MLTLRHYCSYKISQLIVSSDATSRGIAAQFIKEGKELLSFNDLSEKKAQQSSNSRELFSIYFVLESFFYTFRSSI